MIDIDNVKSPEEAIGVLLSLYDKVKQVERIEAEQSQYDPYYFFKPSTGLISDRHRAFLKKWLRPDDIPQMLPGQDQFFKSLDANIIGLFGGNQSGKTTCPAIAAYAFVTGVVPPGLEGMIPESWFPKKRPVHVRVVGVDHKTFLKNLLPVYQFWCPRDFLKNGKWDDSYSAEKQILELRKDGKFYGTVEFMTNAMDVESFQGPPRHLVIYDEEPDLPIYKENLMRFVTADRIRIIFGMTPTRGLSWVKNKILDRREDDGNSIKCFKLSTVTNNYANLDVVEEILRELDTYDEIKMRILGEFISLGGLVYGGLFDRNLHLVKPFPVTRDFIVYRGLDPHLVKPTVCVEVAVDRFENHYVIGVYKKSADTDEIKADLANRVQTRGWDPDEKKPCPWRIGWTRCDTSANSNIKVLGDRNVFRELKRGSNAIPAMFTSDKYSGSIKAGIDLIKKKLKVNPVTGKPTLFIFDTPECWMIVQAFENMERERSQNEERSGVRDEIAEGPYDAHAALRYIYQGSPRWVNPDMTIPNPDKEVDA